MEAQEDTSNVASIASARTWYVEKDTQTTTTHVEEVVPIHVIIKVLFWYTQSRNEESLPLSDPITSRPGNNGLHDYTVESDSNLNRHSNTIAEEV